MSRLHPYFSIFCGNSGLTSAATTLPNAIPTPDTTAPFPTPGSIDIPQELTTSGEVDSKTDALESAFRLNPSATDFVPKAPSMFLKDSKVAFPEGRERTKTVHDTWGDWGSTNLTSSWDAPPTLDAWNFGAEVDADASPNKQISDPAVPSNNDQETAGLVSSEKQEDAENIVGNSENENKPTNIPIDLKVQDEETNIKEEPPVNVWENKSSWGSRKPYVYKARVFPSDREDDIPPVPPAPPGGVQFTPEKWREVVLSNRKLQSESKTTASIDYKPRRLDPEQSWVRNITPPVLPADKPRSFKDRSKTRADSNNKWFSEETVKPRPSLKPWNDVSQTPKAFSSNKA